MRGGFTARQLLPLGGLYMVGAVSAGVERYLAPAVGTTIDSVPIGSLGSASRPAQSF